MFKWHSEMVKHIGHNIPFRYMELFRNSRLWNKYEFNNHISIGKQIRKIAQIDLFADLSGFL